jgi:hypothetical protein
MAHTISNIASGTNSGDDGIIALRLLRLFLFINTRLMLYSLWSSFKTYTNYTTS